MSGVNEIRSTFLDYFAKNGHERVDSSSLVPRNDPTLMFTNAGMVQFKNIFTGAEKSPYARATTAQKCMRAGGKHNDLDNVGYTARHHTFFEMLGNFSFGDYFKDHAIELAWNLLTKEFGIPEKKLLVTIYAEDDEAGEIWKKVSGLPETKILRIATNDNFWQMGDVGPCGPCSEIFYDHGDLIPGGPPGSSNENGDRFIEIWNQVFMQFEQLADGQRIALPKPSIDTGMGLERMAAVLQGTHDNYAIDLMQALIGTIEDLTHVSARGEQKVSHRVIADHLRASAFLVADGVLPTNEGRGYVLRRIMRRAMRHVQLLGMRSKPLMWQLVPTLIREMGQAYPELIRAESLITETLQLEETRFGKTLERGLSILDGESAHLKKGQNLSGETAFTLYDTYGFPLDLTQDALKSRGIGVDTKAFEKAMEHQREKARANWKGSGETATETVWFNVREKTGATEFLGYDTETAEGVVCALVKDGCEVPVLQVGEAGFAILNQTPFFGESGGQVGDTGIMVSDVCRLIVSNTEKKLGDLFIHHVQVEQGDVKPGISLELTVDHQRRRAIRANHSATHLLHEALRDVLGDHVAQKGSLVSSDRLRFDFNHPKAMTEEEVCRVENIANEVVLQNTPVVTHLMAVDDALKSGARALFGEKYGEEVRVVSMGETTDFQKKLFSVELCGGTHVARTGDIGLISILSESGVAAGVRRLEALTGALARQHLNEESRQLRTIANMLKTSVDDLPQRLNGLIEDKRNLEKEASDMRKKIAMGEGTQSDDIKTLNGTVFLGRVIQNVDMRDLKSLADEGKKRVGSGVVVIIGVSEDGKAGAVVGVTGEAEARFDAVALVRIASEKLGGKGGGGRKDMAQAGGPNGQSAEDALKAVELAVAESP